MGKYEIEARREEIRRLKRMGWLNSRIAQYLGIPEGTLFNDLAIIEKQEKELRESNQKLIEDTTKAIVEMLEKYQNVEKEAWKCYMEILLPVERIKALAALVKVYSDVAKLLKLIDYGQGINIEKYINIENLVPMLNQVILVIDKYIPEEKKLEAYKELKQIEILKDKTNE